MKVFFGCKINYAQAFAWQDAEPLLHLIHPGAMYRGEMHDPPGRLDTPLADFATGMGADSVTDERTRGEVCRNLPRSWRWNGEACRLACA